jgi:hypothetical protein
MGAFLDCYVFFALPPLDMVHIVPITIVMKRAGLAVQFLLKDLSVVETLVVRYGDFTQHLI